MARGRMIAKTLSTSQRFARLFEVTPDLAEFAQSLYPLLVAHADDFGRQQGDTFTVRHSVHPTSPRAAADFDTALQALHDVGLIVRYEARGRQCIQIAQFDRHQQGLHKRTESEFPGPDGSPGREPRPFSLLDASEEEIEDKLERQIRSGRLAFSGLTVQSIDRQVRKGASYIDILVTTVEGALLVIEVKRSRVTVAALEQVKKYADLFGVDTVPVVIGHGLAEGNSALTGDVLVAIYDDRLRVQMIAPYRVKSREVTLLASPDQEKRREEKGTELKRTKGKGATEPAPTTELLKLFDELHQERFGSPAAIVRGKDAAMLAEIWRTRGTDDTVALIRAFFRLQDDWVLQRGFSVAIFKSQLSRLLVRHAKPQPAAADWFDECKRLHDGTCNGSQGHRIQMLIDADRSQRSA